MPLAANLSSRLLPPPLRSMAESPLPLRTLALLFVASLSFPRSCAAVAPQPPLCPLMGVGFLEDLQSQCPRWIELSWPQEMSGKALERVLTSADEYYSVLFYASWCPFSFKIRPIFDALTSMFPQIKHLLVEESSVTPSLLSINSIHSFPTIMLVNRTSKVQYHGSKDLTSLVHFYHKNTGLDPIIFLTIDQHNSGNVKHPVPLVASARDLMTKEPYLTFGILFLILKLIICSFSVIYSRLRTFWVSHAWHLNLRILRELGQLLKQALHMIDIRRLWSKLGLCNKTRNFQKGANNARAWASSLASVSLGESSSSS